MTVTQRIGDPPSDPRTISHDARCFEDAGVAVSYVVVMSAPRYPETFSRLEDAEEFARKTGRVVDVRERRIKRRISWTLPA